MAEPTPEGQRDKGRGAGSALESAGAGTRSSLRETVVAWTPSSQGEVDVTNPHATISESIVPLPPKSAEEASPKEGDGLTLDDTGMPPEFILRRRIATGGQGEVWDALQTSLDREVAIKLVRASSGEVNQSFLHEAWTVATLDHPNIVPVYELSQTRILGSHCHLLAMKLLRGRSWDQHLEKDRHSDEFSANEFLAKHLKILSSVCNALAYAHSKNIIHLDLKPSQVVLGDFGEVYLLDWGLSMTVHGETPQVSSSSQPKFRTRDSTTAPSGTPAYMAPEQTLGHGAGLGFHTDIYLLGAMLFEILAGYPPHFDSTVSNAYRRAKANDLNELPDHCPEDLRALVNRALATDPMDRPDSVEEFHQAVEEFLDGTSRKSESQEVTESVASQMVVLQTTSRYEVLGEADRRLTRALTLWPGNEQAAELRQAVVERWTEVALDVNDLRLARTLLPEIESEAARERLSRGVAAARLHRQRVTRQRRQLILISSLFFITLVAFALKYSFDQRVAKTRLQDERDRAELARQQAEGLVNFLIDDLYQGLEPLGRLDLLEQVANESMSYFEKIPAESNNVEATQKRSAALRNIAEVLRGQGHLDEARLAYEGAIRAVRELDLSGDALQVKALLAENLASYSRFLYHQRELEDAFSHEEEALQLREQLVGAEPENTLYSDKLAASFNQLGVIRWRQGQPDEAKKFLLQSEEIRQRLLEEDPDNQETMASLSWTLGTLGVILIDHGDLREAVDVVERSLVFRRELAARDPNNATWRGRLAWSLGSLGELNQFMGKPEEALRIHSQALTILQGLWDNDPTNNKHPNEVAWSHEHVGQALESLGRSSEALGEYYEALKLREGALERSPGDVHVLEEKAYNLYRIAHAEFGEENIVLAKEELEKALEIAEPLLERSPTNAAQRAALAKMSIMRGRIAKRVNDEKAAEEAFLKALEYIEPVTENSRRVEYIAAHVAALFFSGQTDRAQEMYLQLVDRGYAEPEFTEMLTAEGFTAAP